MLSVLSIVSVTADAAAVGVYVRQARRDRHGQEYERHRQDVFKNSAFLTDRS